MCRNALFSRFLRRSEYPATNLEAGSSNLSGRTNINDLAAIFFRAVLLSQLCY
jgi:hypothetical protein